MTNFELRKAVLEERNLNNLKHYSRQAMKAGRDDKAKVYARIAQGKYGEDVDMKYGDEEFESLETKNQ